MAVLFLLGLLSILGSSLAYVPSGPQIQLQATLLTGGFVYVKNTADENQYTFTTSTADATVFTLDTASGFLYQATSDLAKFPSGYSVPAVTNQGLLSASALLSYDGTGVLTAPGYYPLSCSHTLTLGPLQLNVPLLCTTNGLGNIYTGFGYCSTIGNILETFGLLGNAAFLLQCGAGSSIV